MGSCRLIRRSDLELLFSMLPALQLESGWDSPSHLVTPGLDLVTRFSGHALLSTESGSGHMSVSTKCNERCTVWPLGCLFPGSGVWHCPLEDRRGSAVRSGTQGYPVGRKEGLMGRNLFCCFRKKHTHSCKPLVRLVFKCVK